MKLLKYFIVIIVLLYDVEAKSFQKSEKNIKDHMVENLYLEKFFDENGGYEMRYVPHVDGKPIFIPFDESEAFTAPSIIKARPGQKRYKPGIGIPSMQSKKIYQNPAPQTFSNLNIPNTNKEVKSSTNPSLIKKKDDHMSEIGNEYLELKKEMENSKMVNQKHHDHPVVIDVVTKADNLNYDETIYFGKVKKKAEVEKATKIKGVKTSLKQKTADKGITKDKNSLQPDNFSKYKLDESIQKSNNHAGDLKERPFDHKDYASPIVAESLTKETYDDYPILIRPQAGSTVGKIETININKKPVDNILKTKKIKSALKTSTSMPEKKVTKSDYDLAMLKHTKFAKDHKNSFSDVSSEQDEVIHFGKVKPPKHHSIIRTQSPVPSKDLFPSEDMITESLFSLDSDYHYGRYSNHDSPIVAETFTKKADDSSYDTPVKDTDDYDSPTVIEAHVKETDQTEDYDSPVVIEAHVKKTDQTEDYDSPVVIEAHVKKTDQTEDYDSPVVIEAHVKKTDQSEDYAHSKVSAAVIKKHPGKDVDQIAHPNKDEKHPNKKENGEKMPDNPPVVVEVKKTPTKPNKKLVKYSTKMKPPKSTMHSHYDDSSKFKDTSENKQSSSTGPNVIKTLFENPVIQSDFLSNEDLFGENDQLDVGSGIINDIPNSPRSNTWPLLTSFHSQERNKFKKCTTPSGEPGNCMPFQMCSTPNLHLTLDDLLKRICAIDEVFIGICCPQFPAETIKVNWESFKNVSSNDQEVLIRKPGECGKIPEFEDSQLWPWMAPLISVTNRRIFCGGVLITQQHVLTAAHCTTKLPRNQITVLLSTNQELEVVEIKRHAQYNPRTMQNDLALLKLSRKVSSPFICLSDENAFVGMEALMLGWQGSFAASKDEEKLLVISTQECRKRGVSVGDNIMCTEPRTEDVVMCNVDSGAPLIVKNNEKYQVIGLLTWNRNDCDSSLPAVFTRVSYFKGWIENHST